MSDDQRTVLLLLAFVVFAGIVATILVLLKLI